MAWFHRLANTFRQDKIRSEIEEELANHIEAHIAHSMARGMSQKEARQDANRRFGSAVTAMEESRESDILIWLDTVLQDLRYGLRSLWKSPGVSVVAVLSLTLAMGASTAIFSVVNAVLLKTLPYRDPDRISLIWQTDTLNRSRYHNPSVANFEDWKARSRTFEDMSAYRTADAAFSVNEEPDWVDFAWVYGDFFRLLGRAPIAGRVFTGDPADIHGVVLSYDFWRSHFGGSADAIGHRVLLSGIAFQVIGVMPEDFRFPSKEIRLWAPAAALPNWQARRRDRQGSFGMAIGRIRAGFTFEQARAEMELIGRQLEVEYPEANQNEGGMVMVPLAVQVHGKSVPFMLAVLFGAVVLVLLIACANVANLLLARGSMREREMAMRVALGASRTRVVRQLLTESVLLSGLAGLLALPLAGLGVRALIAMAPQGIARLDESRLDFRVLAFSFALSVATGITFGLAPALRVSQDASDRNHTGGSKSRWLRRVFVLSEVALAVVLIVGAGLLVRSYAAVQAVDPGFQTDRTMSATLRFRNNLPGIERLALYRAAIDRLGRLPGVSAAGAVSTMFYSGEPGKFGLRAVEGHALEPREKWSAMTWSTISGDYFQALGVPLVAGRFFSDRDTDNMPPVVIINESMARRYWPGENPIGKGIKGFDERGHHDEWVRVVGVVKDMHSLGLEHGPMSQIYEAQAQHHDETENLVVRGTATAAGLRDAVRAVDRSAVLMDVSELKARLREQNAPRRFQTVLVSLFAAMALVLASAGIFALMHFSVAQRTREIGIRMAMGARPGNVVGVVMREGILLGLAGTGFGLVLSVALTRSIRSVLFGVDPGDPITLGCVSLLLVTTAALACYLPARNATRVDPVVALRAE